MISTFHKSGFYILLIAFAFILLSFCPNYISTADAIEISSLECIKCHEKVYLEAINYTYQHSILKEACTHCHVRVKPQGETYSTMNFSTFQKEQIVHLDDIDPEQVYQAEVMVTDERGTRCLPKRVKTDIDDPSERNSQYTDIKTISNVTIDEVKKGGFVRAVLSWNTNAYSTSEVVYWSDKGRKSKFRSGRIFSKKHSVILPGLRHRTQYKFQVVSKDFSGNMIESDEYTLDTSKNIAKSDNSKYKPPTITHLTAFTIKGQPGVFLKVFANKAAELSVKLIEIKDRDTKHGFGLLDPIVTMIDTCTKCHPRGTSHPVGVKATGRKIRTPDELPTIDDGIITCVTCHSPHGGDNAFFARFDRNKDICILCHIGGY